MNGFSIEDVTARFDPQDIAANKAVAALSIIPILFWLPFVAAKDSAFAKFYANQGLLLLLAGVVGRILGHIPLLGGILSWLISVCVVVCVILGLVWGFQGQAKKLPFIGDVVIFK